MRAGRRITFAVAVVTVTGLAAFELGSAQLATATPTPTPTAAAAAIVDTGGSVLSHRSSSNTGALGVTFSFETSSLAGGPYTDSWPVYNVPMYQANTAGTPQFWLNYVEELVSAGVNYVAVDTRGYVPGSTVPNEGGDPRELTQLVNAINTAGDAGKLKIAAFDDTPASMTDKMNQIVHGAGGYSPPFDFSVTTGSGNGG